MTTKESITQLLRLWQQGDSQSEQRLYDQVLPVLRRQARMVRNDHKGMVSLDTTEIMHEAYLKLEEIKQLSFKDKAHFYAISAKVIRHLVIDHMRKQNCQKRGGRLPMIPIDEVENVPCKSYDSRFDWLALELALNDLFLIDPVCARVIEMKFFSAMTLEEMSQVCGCSIMTIRRKWRFAKAWLASQLKEA